MNSTLSTAGPRQSLATPSGTGGVPGLDFSKLHNQDKNPPGSTTNKNSGRNSYRSLISPSSERAKNALADRLKRGIGASGNDEDKEEEFEIKELTNEEYKDFLAQYDKSSKCVTPAPETSQLPLKTPLTKTGGNN